MGEERPAQPCRLPLGVLCDQCLFGAKAHYRRRRDEHGDWHAVAQRNLFNRMIGQLYHCLQTNQLFDEHVAFPSQLATAA